MKDPFGSAIPVLNYLAVSSAAATTSAKLNSNAD